MTVGTPVLAGHREMALNLVRVFGIQGALDRLARWAQDDRRYEIVAALIRGDHERPKEAVR